MSEPAYDAAASVDHLLADEVAPSEVTATSVPFEGHVWDVRRDEFRYGTDVLTREYVDHTGAVAVLAIDDERRVMLIKQYRHPITAREWELPAGLLDVEGEDPVLAAQRELAEEADLVASEWSELVRFHTSPGGSNEEITTYLARRVAEADEIFARSEEEADLETRWVPLDEVVEAILAGRLHNSILIIAVLTAHARGL